MQQENDHSGNVEPVGNVAKFTGKCSVCSSEDQERITHLKHFSSGTFIQKSRRENVAGIIIHMLRLFDLLQPGLFNKELEKQIKSNHLEKCPFLLKNNKKNLAGFGAESLWEQSIFNPTISRKKAYLK